MSMASRRRTPFGGHRGFVSKRYVGWHNLGPDGKPVDFGEWVLTHMSVSEHDAKLLEALKEEVIDESIHASIAELFVSLHQLSLQGKLDMTVGKDEKNLEEVLKREESLRSFLHNVEPNLRTELKYEGGQILDSLQLAMDQLYLASERLQNLTDHSPMEYRTISRLGLSDAAFVLDVAEEWIELVLDKINLKHQEIVSYFDQESTKIDKQLKELLGDIKNDVDIQNQKLESALTQISKQQLSLRRAEQLLKTLEDKKQGQCLNKSSAIDKQISDAKQRISEGEKHIAQLKADEAQRRQNLSQLDTVKHALQQSTVGLTNLNRFSGMLQKDLVGYKKDLQTFFKETKSVYNTEIATQAAYKKEHYALGLLKIAAKSTFCGEVAEYTQVIHDSIMRGYQSPPTAEMLELSKKCTERREGSKFPLPLPDNYKVYPPARVNPAPPKRPDPPSSGRPSALSAKIASYKFVTAPSFKDIMKKS